MKDNGRIINWKIRKILDDWMIGVRKRMMWQRCFPLASEYRPVSFHVWSKRWVDSCRLPTKLSTAFANTEGRALQISPRFLDSNPVSTLCAPRTKM